MFRSPVRIVSVLSASLFFLTLNHAHAQQDYVGRYDIYNGYANLIAPKIDLTTRGYHLQAGWNWKPWIANGLTIPSPQVIPS